MKVVLEVAHPKHFHQFLPLARVLSRRNEVLFLVKQKDVLIKLVEAEGLPFVLVDSRAVTIIGKLFLGVNLLLKYWRIYRQFQPDLVISRASPYSALLSLIFRFKSVILPDSEVVNLTRRLVAPISNIVITPKYFEISLGNNHERVDGFFEEAYLSSFESDNSNSFDLGFDINERFCLIRFVGWDAHHDTHQFGFSAEQKIFLVEKLKNYGRVCISSESELPESISQYRLEIPPSSIHTVLQKASMYLGDSQSMATEACLLGTPAIRYNSFVGPKDMSNFKILEKEYNMLSNFSDFEETLKAAMSLFQNLDAKSNMITRRNQYFQNKRNITEQTIEIIQKHINITV